MWQQKRVNLIKYFWHNLQKYSSKISQIIHIYAHVGVKSAQILVIYHRLRQKCRKLRQKSFIKWSSVVALERISFNMNHFFI
jgi:hypothetical protein